MKREEEQQQQRLDAFQSAISCLSSRVSASDRKDSLELLHRILSNIVSRPDNPRVRQIRRGNETFIRSGGRFPEVIQAMEAVGFRETKEWFELSLSEEEEGMDTKGDGDEKENDKRSENVISSSLLSFLQMIVGQLEEQLATLGDAHQREEAKRARESRELMATLREEQKRKVETEKSRLAMAASARGSGRLAAALRKLHPRLQVVLGEERKSEDDKDGNNSVSFVGLTNLGATCYMNSVLQSWYHLLPLRELVLRRALSAAVAAKVPISSEEMDNNNNNSNSSSSDSGPKAILYQMHRLFLEMMFSPFEVSTRPLTRAFGWNASDVYIQQDAHEFVRLLESSLSPDEKEEKKSEAISKLFSGKLVSRIHCPSVNYIRDTEEAFSDLSLDVHHGNITAALKALVHKEEMSGDNAVDCGPIHGKQTATKQVQIVEFPPVLVLHLMRFQFDPASQRITKLNDRVEFPRCLDAEKVVAEEEQEPNSSSSSSPQYQLFAVVAHLGSHSGGHYVTFVRPDAQCFEDNNSSNDNSNSMYPTGQWFKFNDSLVTAVPESEAMDGCFGGSGWTAYMLVYTKPLISRRDFLAAAGNNSSQQQYLEAYQRYEAERQAELIKEEEEKNIFRIHVLSERVIRDRERELHLARNASFGQSDTDFVQSISLSTDLFRWFLAPVVECKGDHPLKEALQDILVAAKVESGDSAANVDSCASSSRANNIRIYACSSLEGGEMENGWRLLGSGALGRNAVQFAPKKMRLFLFVSEDDVSPSSSSSSLLFIRSLAAGGGGGGGSDFKLSLPDEHGLIFEKALLCPNDGQSVQEILLSHAGQEKEAALAMLQKAWILKENGEMRRLHATWTFGENRVVSGDSIILPSKNSSSSSSSSTICNDTIRSLKQSLLVVFLDYERKGECLGFARLNKRDRLEQCCLEIGRKFNLDPSVIAIMLPEPSPRKPVPPRYPTEFRSVGGVAKSRPVGSLLPNDTEVAIVWCKRVNDFELSDGKSSPEKPQQQQNNNVSKHKGIDYETMLVQKKAKQMRLG